MRSGTPVRPLRHVWHGGGVQRVARWKCGCGEQVPADGTPGYASGDGALLGWVAHWRDAHHQNPLYAEADIFTSAGQPPTLTVEQALARLVPAYEHL